MKTQQLISTYQLNFFNAIEEIGNTSRVYDKRLITCNDFLTWYLSEWDKADEIDSELIPEFQAVINGTTANHFSTNGEFTFIKSAINETKIYDINSISEPIFTLPTQDFYDILTLWRDFLNEPPLSGTLVDKTTA